ncbi:MAG: hypothetical protein MZV70_17735 [Desulfobacterales bacterium]|nr:hypothetical protein [Desulfobacterales bacterium]
MDIPPGLQQAIQQHVDYLRKAIGDPGPLGACAEHPSHPEVPWGRLPIERGRIDPDAARRSGLLPFVRHLRRRARPIPKLEAAACPIHRDPRPGWSWRRSNTASSPPPRGLAMSPTCVPFPAPHHRARQGHGIRR